MLDGDFHPDRILAGIGVLQDEIAAGVLDVADHRGRRVGACLITHEADGPLRADLDAVDAGHPRAKARLHAALLDIWSQGLKSVVGGRASRGKSSSATSPEDNPGRSIEKAEVGP